MVNSFASVLRNIRLDAGRQHSIYRPHPVRRAAAALLKGSLWGGVGWMFFSHWLPMVLLAAIGGWNAWKNTEPYIRKQKQLVSVQFEQLLFAVASALQAGKSVENAFLAAEADLKLMYREQASILLSELSSFNRKVGTGTPLEKAIDEFQRRIDIPEVSHWANIFSTCKRTGGDLVQVMRNSSRLIAEKLSMERELAVLIAGKRFEAKALAIVPFLVIGLFRFGSPDYMMPLYEGSGRFVMLAALVMIGLGMKWAERIMRIEV